MRTTPITAGSVYRAGRYRVGELLNSSRDPAPCRRAVLIIAGSKLVGARYAFVKRVIALALEHELRRPPDINLGDHAGKTVRPLSIKA